MGMTMTQKILAAGAGLPSVEAGQLIEAKLDLVLGNDITAPVAIKEMDRFKKQGVFDKDKIALVPDHFVPAKDIKSAENCKCVREFARRNRITNYFEVGQMGIEHALLPESGLVSPGDVIIGADSHTCTYGPGCLLHGRRLHGHGCRHGNREGLVQGSAGSPLQPDGRAWQVGLRQGRDPAHHRHDRRRRRPVPVDGVHRPRCCLPLHG